MFNRRPIFGITLFFIVGVLAVYQDWNLILVSAMALVAIVLFLVLRQSNIMISLFCIAFFALALFLTNLGIARYEKVSFNDGEKYGIVGIVTNQGQSDVYELLTINVESVNGNNADFQMQLYVYNFDEIYGYGDEIYATTQLNNPLKAKFKGDFDTYNYAMSRGLRYIESTDSSAVELISHNNKISISKLAFGVRKYFWGTAKELLPADEAAFSQGLMLGDTLSFTDEMKSNFRVSGVTHITALSGTNVSIISMIIFFLLSRLSRKRVLINILSGLAIIAFYIIVGYSPSVLRAVIMALVAVTGNLNWRRSEVFNTMAISLLLILIYNPFALFDVGLQLSFLAVLGMALFSKPFTNNERILKKAFVILLIPTIFSLLTTGIVTASSFNQVNFTAIWTNIIVVPISTIALVGSYIMCILHAIWIPLGQLASYFIFIVIWLMKKIIDLSANYAIMNLKVGAPSLLQIAIYCAFLYLLYTVEVKVIELWSRKHS